MENTLEKNSFSITEARRYLGGGKNGISKYLIYQLLDDGKLKSYWVGQRRFILKSELDRYISASEVPNDTDLCNCVEDNGDLCEKCREQYERENIFEVITFFYDSTSGELDHSKTDFTAFFKSESALMQADVLKDMYEVIATAYNEKIEEFPKQIMEELEREG